MWIRKIERDLKKDVDSPLPTQAVSNEEFLPRPQTPRQKQLEALIREMGDTRARKLNMDRRAFMASSMGLATCFAASNRVYGKVFEVDDAETYELAAIDEKYPKGEFFVIDVQAHFTNGIALNFRNSETARNMGFNLKDDVESYSFKNFVKELFFDSETNMVVISGVPTREIQRTPDGKVAEGAQRNPPFAILPSWLMGEKKKEINDMAGSQRALCQGNLAPNHYWDKATNSLDKAAMLEQMERELQLYKIDSWKWYCHTDPGGSGGGFQLDASIATSGPDAVRDAEIICTTTSAREPVLFGEWLSPGTHLDCVGAYRPSMRETDDEVVRRARVFADTRIGAFGEAGDILQPIAAGVIGKDAVLGDLFDLTRGVVTGRVADNDITFFKSVGASIEDLAAAVAVYETA